MPSFASVERLVAQPVERLAPCACFLPSVTVNGGRPTISTSSRVRARAGSRRPARRAARRDRRRGWRRSSRPRSTLIADDSSSSRSTIDELVAVRRRSRQERRRDRRRRVVDVVLDEPVRRSRSPRPRCRSRRAGALSPALELVQRLREPARSGPRSASARRRPVGDDDVLRSARATSMLLELRLLLDVLLPARRSSRGRAAATGDVDVSALDELRHLPVEEREDQRADVRAVDVGVGHHDHAVVAELLEVELVADARCRSR